MKSEYKEQSIWHEFVAKYEKQIPYKSIGVILEAFYWYCQMDGSNQEDFKINCNHIIKNLMLK